MKLSISKVYSTNFLIKYENNKHFHYNISLDGGYCENLSGLIELCDSLSDFIENEQQNKEEGEV